MPCRETHLKFDQYLIDHGIVYSRDFSNIHDRKDRDLQIYGHWNHRDADYYHDITGIREWIRSWSHLAYQETLTDYVRIALGHLVLDELWSNYDYDDDYELMKSAYMSFIKRGFARCFFK